MFDTSLTHTLVKHDVTGDEWKCPNTYLVDAREKGWRPVGEPVDSAYAGMKNDDLKAEITRRNGELSDDEQLSLDGNKPDLIATLLADDARRHLDA
jgi:hypothetical protein